MTQIRWEGFTHAEIYERVHAGPGRGASTAVESAWADTESVILGIEQQLAAAIRDVGAGWEGAAADATRAGLTPLGRWAMDAAGDARLTATGVTAQGEQAAWLRHSMPSPTTPLWDEPGGRPVSDPLYLLEDAQALQHKAAEDAAHAVHLMNTYTTHSYDNVRLMNYWTLPPAVTVEAVGAPAGGQLGGPVPGAGTPGTGSVGVLPPAGPGWSGSGGAPGSRGPAPGRPQAGGPAAGGSGARGTGAGGRQDGPAGTGLPAPTGRPPTETVPPDAARTGPAAPRTLPADPTGAAPPGPSAPPPTPGPSWRDRLPSTRGPAAPPAAEPAGRPGRGPVTGPVPGVPAPRPTVGVGPGAPSGRGPLLEPAGVPGRGPVAEPGRTPHSEPAGPAGRASAHLGGPPAAGYPARPGAPGLYPPMFGLGAAGSDREHRRPDYLLDDGGAFLDDRWFPPPVIGPDDVPPTPPRWTA